MFRNIYIYFRFFVYLLADLRSFEAVDLECNFNIGPDYGAVGPIYRCEVKTNLNIKSPEDAIINAISGTHMSGKTNDDVLTFDAMSKIIDYFPKGLEKWFKNLKAIRMLNGRLKQISQSDLKPFPNLVYLEIQNTDIQILEDDLFTNHPNIQVVWLLSNKIFHVGKNVFNNMNDITWLGFESNPCISINALNNSTAAKLIIDSLKTKCFDVNFANFSQNIANIENESKTLTFDNFQVWSRKVKGLEKEFQTSKFAYLTSIKERFLVLKAIKIEEFPDYLIFKLENLENNLSKGFAESLNHTEHSLKNTCTEVSKQSFNVMKGELSKVNEKVLEHSSEVRSELIKSDVQHFTILSRIANLEGKLETLEEKLVQILDAVNKIRW